MFNWGRLAITDYYPSISPTQKSRVFVLLYFVFKTNCLKKLSCPSVLLFHNKNEGKSLPSVPQRGSYAVGVESSVGQFKPRKLDKTVASQGDCSQMLKFLRSFTCLLSLIMTNRLEKSCTRCCTLSVGKQDNNNDKIKTTEIYPASLIRLRVVVLTLCHRYSAVCRHRTGSNE